ncbi:T9SS type A sorting domain-containing protein [Leadbetterella sp. DM7]|uniref:T9SS type A sorting domain-containing protein n=1 Tax=Leadbetterella sp. DM7 TaxID=3235085 RepID=UPI00349EE1DF
MKKLFKTFAVLAVSSTLAFANVNPTSFKVGMYNVQNTHMLKVFVNKESSNALLLEICDAKGRVIQSEQVGKNKHNMGLNLNLSELESGDYTIRLSDKTSTFTKEIRLEKEQKEELKIVI